VLTAEKVQSLWAKVQEFPIMFDHFSKGNPQQFMQTLLNRTNVFYEIGDEVGLASATAVRPKLDAVVHLIMFDRRLRGREQIFHEILEDLFDLAQLRRVTAVVATAKTPTTGKLLQRLNFTHEGTMRQAILVDEGYVDLDVYGLLREEL
jgi:RimJ/RimL family protein N-acetyltransferase